MSELSIAILDILSSVTAPMTSASMVKVLFCTGITSNGGPIPVELITAALNELVIAGRVECVRRHGAETFKAISGLIAE